MIFEGEGEFDDLETYRCHISEFSDQDDFSYGIEVGSDSECGEGMVMSLMAFYDPADGSVSVEEFIDYAQEDDEFPEELTSEDFSRIMKNLGSLYL